MKTKTRNKNQTDFSAVGPTYFELWVMETELWAMETQKPNSLFVSSPSLHKRPPPLELKVLSPEERTMVTMVLSFLNPRAPQVELVWSCEL